MPVLISAVVLVGALCSLDLILTLGVIKRLREHGELLAARAVDRPRSAIELGEPVGEFATHTVDGEPLGRATITGTTLVGFFTPTCGPCKEQLPKFMEYARTVPGGRDRVLAAVVGDEDLAAPMVAELRSVAKVVTQTRNEEPLGAAFEIMAFPTVLMVAPDAEGDVVVTDDAVDLSRPTLPV